MRALGFVVVAAFGCTPLPTSEVGACLMKCMAQDSKIKQCGVSFILVRQDGGIQETEWGSICAGECCRPYVGLNDAGVLAVKGHGHSCGETITQQRAIDTVSCVDATRAVDCSEVVHKKDPRRPNYVEEWAPEACVSMVPK